jgi:hypothetical protein
MNALNFFSIVAAATMLAACGGGGGDASPAPTAATFEPTLFYGTYADSDNACKRFTYGNNQYSKRTTLTIDATTAVGMRDIFSDAECTMQIGSLAITVNIELSASTLEDGNINIANLQSTYGGFKLSSLNPSSPVVMTSRPDPGRQGKGIIKLVGSALYSGASSSPIDANGYPTTFDFTSPIATKK